MMYNIDKSHLRKLADAGKIAPLYDDVSLEDLYIDFDKECVCFEVYENKHSDKVEILANGGNAWVIDMGFINMVIWLSKN